jgi:hypothetical protein
MLTQSVQDQCGRLEQVGDFLRFEVFVIVQSWGKPSTQSLQLARPWLRQACQKLTHVWSSNFEHGSPSSVAPFSSSCPSQKRLEKFPHREQRESGMRVMSTSLAPAVLRVCSFCSKFLPGTKIPGSARRVQHLQVQQIASVGHSGCIQIYHELIPADLQTSEGKLIISNSETAALRKSSLGK